MKGLVAAKAIWIWKWREKSFRYSLQVLLKDIAQKKEALAV